MKEKKKRRKALLICAFAFVIWAVFAYKDTRKGPTIPTADNSTRSVVSTHLKMESNNPLSGYRATSND